MSRRSLFALPRLPLAVFVCTLLCALGLALVTFTDVPRAHAQAVLPSPGVVRQNANQRSGPGTTYPIVAKSKVGDTVVVVEANPAGDWYHLENGNWMAAFLVALGGHGRDTRCDRGLGRGARPAGRRLYRSRNHDRRPGPVASYDGPVASYDGPRRPRHGHRPRGRTNGHGRRRHGRRHDRSADQRRA